MDAKQHGFGCPTLLDHERPALVIDGVLSLPGVVVAINSPFQLSELYSLERVAVNEDGG
jgi:hypothetical protein